jgi:hypothetical protein
MILTPALSQTLAKLHRDFQPSKGEGGITPELISLFPSPFEGEGWHSVFARNDGVRITPPAATPPRETFP